MTTTDEQSTPLEETIAGLARLEAGETDRAPMTVGADAFLGLTYLELTPDRVVAEAQLGPQHRQPAGIINGGIYCMLVESVGSMAGTALLRHQGYVVGVNNDTDFLRSMTDGLVTVTATPVHRGRRQQLWEVHVVHGDDLVARGSLRLQNITENSAS